MHPALLTLERSVARAPTYGYARSRRDTPTTRCRHCPAAPPFLPQALWLDSDAMPIYNPELLFDTPQFKEHGR